MDNKCSSLSDEELVHATQANSLEAFEELVFRYEQRIYRFVAMNTMCEADAREITQDTFVRAFQAITQFRPEFAFSSWLFAIARRRQIDWFRLARRRSTTEMTAPGLITEENAADNLAQREAGQRIWQVAKACLTPAQFEVLWLKYVEDMSISEIAELVHKSVPHVKVLLFRARREMSKALRSGDPTFDLLSDMRRVGNKISEIPGEAL